MLIFYDLSGIAGNNPLFFYVSKYKYLSRDRLANYGMKASRTRKVLLIQSQQGREYFILISYVSAHTQETAMAETVNLKC